MDNKLSIHFGEVKTKSILFASKFKRKNIQKLNTKYGDIQIKQYSKVKYLGCFLDETMSGEAVALNVIYKINSKLKFFTLKIVFLTLALRRLLCNALIQPHFDYVCSAWYSNLTKKIKHRIQTPQNKCIRFCLQLGNLKPISLEEFEHFNWLPVTYKFKQSVNSIVFKYFLEQCFNYLSEVFNVARESNDQLKG